MAVFSFNYVSRGVMPAFEDGLKYFKEWPFFIAIRNIAELKWDSSGRTATEIRVILLDIALESGSTVQAQLAN